MLLPTFLPSQIAICRVCELASEGLLVPFYLLSLSYMLPLPYNFCTSILGKRQETWSSIKAPWLFGYMTLGKIPFFPTFVFLQ